MLDCVRSHMEARWGPAAPTFWDNWERQFAQGGEPGHSGASHWTDGREMPLLMGIPVEGYLRTDRPRT